MKKILLLILIPICLFSESRSEENIDWLVKSSKITLENGNYYIYHLRKIEYKKNGNTSWSRDLPDWLKNKEIERSFNKPVDIKEYNGFPFIMGVIIDKKYIYIADKAGIVLFEKQTGKIVLNEKLKSNNDSFFIDGGTAKIQTPKETCEIKVKSGNLFSKCGNELFYFNRNRFIVLDENGVIKENIGYDPKEHKVLSKNKLHYELKIQFTDSMLVMEGLVYVK